jgi:NitT/TauT family transport system permease protein
MILLGVLSLCAVIGAWEWAVRSGRLAPSVASSPSRIWATAWDLHNSGLLVEHLAASGGELGIGFGATVVIGSLLGWLFARSRFLGAIFLPFILLLEATPRVAFTPLLVMKLGPEPIARVIAIALCALTPIVLGVRASVSRTEAEDRWPHAVRSIRTGFHHALTGLIVAEMYVYSVVVVVVVVAVAVVELKSNF